MDDEKVKCNSCGWQGYEDELILCVDDEGFFNGCPHCLTDSYLMDVSNE